MSSQSSITVPVNTHDSTKELRGEGEGVGGVIETLAAMLIFTK